MAERIEDQFTYPDTDEDIAVLAGATAELAMRYVNEKVKQWSTN